MRIYKADNYADLSRKAANILSAQIILKPNSVMGLATGSSPIGVYKQLIEWFKKGDLDFSEVTTINLDEYRGIVPDNEQSYRYFMDHQLFRHINIRPENTYLPNGLEPDAEKECARYDGIIQACGGIDMQLLGVGHNGHIGFNEPGGSFERGTHCVSLTDRTIDANQRFFASREDVPKQAYTMGIKTIMQAHRVVVVVSGMDKAQIIRQSFRGPVTPEVPASVLQLHNNVTLVGDKEALSLL